MPQVFAFYAAYLVPREPINTRMSTRPNHFAKQEWTEQQVFDKFIALPTIDLVNVRRGNRIDFVADNNGIRVGIELQSYQHTAGVLEETNLKQKLVSEAQELFEAVDKTELTVSFLYRDGFPPKSKLGRDAQQLIVKNIVKYVRLFTNDDRPDTSELSAIRLDSCDLGDVFYHITLRSDIHYTDNRGKWIAQPGSWFQMSLNDVVDEIGRRVAEKDIKHAGYVIADSCEEYWLLLHHDGNPISDINLADGMSEEAKNALEEVAKASPFSRLYVFDPYWTSQCIRIK